MHHFLVEKKYLSREDFYTYEWVNGMVEKTKRSMDTKQFAIEDNILDAFYKLKFAGKFTGQIITEGDMFFLGNHRRPGVLVRLGAFEGKRGRPHGKHPRGH